MINSFIAKPPVIINAPVFILYDWLLLINVLL